MVTHYECPNCGADMKFDSETGMLLCESCGNTIRIEDYSEDLITERFSDDEAKEYHCDNCGAVVITDKDTTATKCSFCGSAVVLSDRLSGHLMPAKVIPFTISKEQARAAFKKWCKNGRLTPKGFMTADRIKEISGMYIPFWLYDLNNKAEVKATATRVRRYSSGDYDYTETKYYDVYRDINLDLIKVPVDASEKMNDDIMDKLEPYNYSDLKDFKTPYLAGYLAEKYDQNAEELYPRVKGKIRSDIDSYISSTIRGYSTVRYNKKDIRTTKRRSAYVLFPIWMVYYDFDKSEHTFAMNGQTGKIVGKPPLSSKKIAMWFGGLAGSSFIAIKLLAYMIGGVLW